MPVPGPKERTTDLLVHTGHDAEHVGLTTTKEHSARCIVTNKNGHQHTCSSGPYRPRCRASGPVCNHREHSAKRTRKTNRAHASARNDVKRGISPRTVLQAHTSRDAEHLSPDDKKSKYNARCNVTSKTSNENVTAEEEDERGQPLDAQQDVLLHIVPGNRSPNPGRPWGTASHKGNAPTDLRPKGVSSRRHTLVTQALYTPGGRPAKLAPPICTRHQGEAKKQKQGGVARDPRNRN